MINRISIQNYRSIRDLELELDGINIIFGPNGCGKSNIYKALHLLSASANGQVSPAISEEGGLENAMWSGSRAHWTPHRIAIACDTDEFEYEMQLGFPDRLPYPTQFQLDTVFKEENIWLSGFERRASARILQRKNQAAFLIDVNGEKQTFTESIYENESIFGQLGEPHRFPEVSQVRERMRSWRFYHDFDLSRHSLLRKPAIGYRSPVLASDGHNLAAAFQTIVEIGAVEVLEEILGKAFPDCRFYVENQRSHFELMMEREGLKRALHAYEMSEGTLRFLCLSVALLSPRPPHFIALNEPENSLHPEMLPALASLIVEAARYSQIWLTSHSPRLAELIGSAQNFRLYQLANQQGETVLA